MPYHISRAEKKRFDYDHPNCSRAETFGYTEKTTRQMYFKAGGVTKKTVIVPFQDVPGDYFLGRQQLFDLTYVPLSVVLAGDLAQETLR